MKIIKRAAFVYAIVTIYGLMLIYSGLGDIGTGIFTREAFGFCVGAIIVMIATMRVIIEPWVFVRDGNHEEEKM